MLSRGIHDSLVMWPAVFWPLVYSSCLYAIVRLCQSAREQYGFSPLDGHRKGDALVLYVFFPLAAVFEVITHAYLIYVVGYAYVALVIPIYICGWILLPWVLDSLPSTQYLLPVVYIGFACAFVVLLGFADVPLLRSVNSELYALLTGLPAKL